LPDSLRDAVTITSHLGIQYFWIDALCIIQGDPDDWAREAGQMCEVYSNAVVTIRGSCRWRILSGFSLRGHLKSHRSNLSSTGDQSMLGIA
ncbi:HET-domain-containing protein, partial [Colletotrichum sublineola]